MKQQKIEVGDIRPVYNVSGFQVCRKASDKEEEVEWTPVEKISDAEILSFVYKQDKQNLVYKQDIGNKKKAGRPRKEKPEENEFDEEDL